MTFLFNEELFGSLPVIKLNVYFEDTYLGFYFLIFHSEELVEVHTDLSPEAIGSAKDISKESLDYVLECYPKVNCMMTKIPINNKLAKKLALSCGFSLCGNIPKSFKYNNTYIDQEIYSFTRSLQCQQ